MVKFELVNNSHFIGYKCPIRKNSENHITVVSKRKFMQTSVVIIGVESLPGKYSVTLNISTKDQLYWYGTYYGASKINIKNGINVFNVEITNKQKTPFTIGIFANALPMGNEFTVYNITVDKVSNTNIIDSNTNDNIKEQQQTKNNNLTIKKISNNNLVDNELPIQKISQNKIQYQLGAKSIRKQQIYDKSRIINTLYKKPEQIINSISKITDVSTNNKNILLVIDVNGWCFDNISKIIKKYYDKRYNIYVEACMDNPDYKKYKNIQFDMIIKFWYGYDKIDPFELYPESIKAVCVYDYIHWNINITKNRNTNIYKKFINNLKRADYILYSCPAIKNLLIEQHNELVKNKQMFAIFDGVDTNKFYFKNYNNNNKLVVGWVGNTSNIYKNFKLLSNTLKNVEWIDFRVQDKNKMVSHDNMVHFYHDIDVVICFSDAEGTPNPILEASSCGRTWVSTNVGIVEMLNNSVIGDSKPGIIIGNKNELLLKLEYLHKNRKIMEHMGSLARQSIEKNFSWNKRVESFGNFFNLMNPSLNLLKSNTTDNNIIKSVINYIEGMDTIGNSSKIIITSTQYPRYGGAATCAYEMHKYLLNNKMSSICIFFDNSIKGNNEKLNPNKLPNVYNEKMPQNHQVLKNFNYDKIISIVKSIYGDEPYTIYSFNYLAPIISKYIFAKSKVYYLITGCNYINNDNLIDTTTFLKNPINIHEKESIEKVTVKIADAIIPNSDLTKNIFEHCYKIHSEEFIDLHEIFKINSALPDNKERIYDIAFICSDFNRKVKNINFMKLMYQNEKLKNFNKICVGKNSENIIGSNTAYKIECKELSSQDEVISILNKTKIVLVTSLIETYSITAVEATQCGCIVLTTKNAACSSTINKFFVLDSYDCTEWINKIEVVLNNYDYFKKIYYNDYQKTLSIDNLWNNNKSNTNKINIVCCSIDIPYVGGCATNMYRIIKYLSTNINFNIYCIFISNTKGNHNPDNLNNVFKISYDSNTENNLFNLKNYIITQINNIDFVFFKNYKIFPFIKKIFGDTKIIFSPSGLRSVSGNTSKDYVMDMIMTPITRKPNINMENLDDIYKFVQDNDMYLDDYALKQSDMVIPNSFLSYKIINQYYPTMPNLQYPIYFTNIIYNGIYASDFKNRPFDVMFCAYDWKRKCKNYQMVLNILNHSESKNLRIIVVGKSQLVQYNHNHNNNISRYEYLDNDRIIDILKEVKVVVIPSKYDSNPNVLVEAIICGCNVVTSTNVGNSENLDKECIVTDYNNVDCWIKTIRQCLKIRYDYKGPQQSKIISDIKNLFTNNKNYKKSVGVYKIPPEFNNLINNQTFAKPIYINYVKAENDDFAFDIVNYDIYFNLFVEISKKENCSNINYILYDDTIEENIYVNVNQLYPTYPKGVTIWKLKDIESFSYFTNGDVYFVRGTYYNFFKQLIPRKAKSIFYPATSMKQTLKNTNNNICFVTSQKFNVVLYHQDSNYNRIYSADKYVSFNKFTTDKFVCFNKEREYDICYVATEKQLTKNHSLFVNFLVYLESIEKKSNVVYIGNLQKILEDNNMTGITDNFKHVTMVNYTYCRSDQLIEIYNKSKINILFSGRDALPRVVSESAACGCFNIALDTLSDGKSFYDGSLGILIGDHNVEKILKPSSSLSYVNDVRLWKKILPFLDKSYDHSHISLQFKEKYNIENILTQIYGQ
ncbi:glycosyltransferases group 1 [Tupanvirus soda lake]|uniref:Glycosyltransferases group 1 n=2 Tax=Tupanvirus TaxID=2094720 RepID=A0A6N1NUF0_9VIRU|nr:glycosyltransferases group 1 [Tupanvirus soda lake]QKU35148.1 glycosyltransferases group 1 [Tupanvirus soda lake]